MRITTEYWSDGATLARTIDDNGDGTHTTTVYDNVGNMVSAATFVVPSIPYAPLDTTGALATLLVVEGVLALTDAANAIQEEEAHLVAEAEAWSLGA